MSSETVEKDSKKKLLASEGHVETAPELPLAN